MEANRRDAGTSVRRDLILIAAATILIAILSVQFEVSEAVLAWTQPRERYQLDELPGVLLFASTAFVWFVWRRVREARAELGRRMVLERELADALVENRRLSRLQVQFQEEERRNLARELHDELGQHLNAIKIDAVAIRQCADGRLPEAHGAAVSIIGILDHVHAVVRDMTRRLRPAGLDELGLPAALENYVEAWRARSPDLRLDLALDGSFADLGETFNITLYRLIQEGLTNVSKHAQARHVAIRLSRRDAAPDQPGEVVLRLTDDGTGARHVHGKSGLGLIGMRERVEALGGRMEAVSEAARGFRITAWLPLGARP